MEDSPAQVVDSGALPQEILVARHAPAINARSRDTRGRFSRRGPPESRVPRVPEHDARAETHRERSGRVRLPWTTYMSLRFFAMQHHKTMCDVADEAVRHWLGQHIDDNLPVPAASPPRRVGWWRRLFRLAHR